MPDSSQRSRQESRRLDTCSPTPAFTSSELNTARRACRHRLVYSEDANGPPLSAENSRSSAFKSASSIQRPSTSTRAGETGTLRPSPPRTSTSPNPRSGSVTSCTRTEAASPGESAVPAIEARKGKTAPEDSSWIHFRRARTWSAESKDDSSIAGFDKLLDSSHETSGRVASLGPPILRRSVDFDQPAIIGYVAPRNTRLAIPVDIQRAGSTSKDRSRFASFVELIQSVQESMCLLPANQSETAQNWTSATRKHENRAGAFY